VSMIVFTVLVYVIVESHTNTLNPVTRALSLVQPEINTPINRARDINRILDELCTVFGGSKIEILLCELSGIPLTIFN
jgi:hypothetical protein